jgi:hypothetical protein
MTKKIMAAAAAIAITAGSIVSTAATAEAHAVNTMSYNPTYCVLFLPFLCLPHPTVAAPHHHHHK